MLLVLPRLRWFRLPLSLVRGGFGGSFRWFAFGVVFLFVQRVRWYPLSHFSANRVGRAPCWFAFRVGLGRTAFAVLAFALFVGARSVFVFFWSFCVRGGSVCPFVVGLLSTLVFWSIGACGGFVLLVPFYAPCVGRPIQNLA